jgi:F1F0 ATPase subunit 2
MSELLTLASNLTAGLVLGAIFYGGLWWTVQRVSARAAGPWLLGSFLVRTVVALAGFYASARGAWYGVAACLAGFLVARIAVTRFTRERSAVDVGAVP